MVPGLGGKVKVKRESYVFAKILQHKKPLVVNRLAVANPNPPLVLRHLVKSSSFLGLCIVQEKRGSLLD